MLNNKVVPVQAVRDQLGLLWPTLFGEKFQEWSLPRDAMLARYAMGGMGLCPSVTNRSSAKIVKCRMVLTVPYNIGILVF